MARAVPQFCQSGLAALGLALTITSCPAASEIAASVRRDTVAHIRPQNFDVPAQPLVSALEAYGAFSGFQVVYDAALAKGRQSSSINGAFTPETALRRLLDGTGLLPRYMAADGFVLVPGPGIGAYLNLASGRAATQYYGRIQTSLRQTFCASAGMRTDGHRVAVGVWIGATGLVARSALLDTTGHPDTDVALEAMVRSMDVGAPPPAGFAQPVVMTIEPDAMRDCAAMQPLRAGR